MWSDLHWPLIFLILGARAAYQQPLDARPEGAVQGLGARGCSGDPTTVETGVLPPESGDLPAALWPLDCGDLGCSIHPAPLKTLTFFISTLCSDPISRIYRAICSPEARSSDHLGCMIRQWQHHAGHIVAASERWASSKTRATDGIRT